MDIGCGISTVLHFVEGERYGIDPLADEYLKMYEYPEGISVQKGVGEKIPFPDEHFDVVFCSNVLDHTDDPRQVLAEIVRVLKNEGHLVLTVHIFDNPFKRDPSHPHAFTKEDVIFLIKGAFMVILEKTSFSEGMYAYVVGGSGGAREELVLVLKKRYH